MKLEFSRQIFKYTQISVSRKSAQWELSCSMRAQVAKLTVTFLNFAKAPIKG